MCRCLDPIARELLAPYALTGVIWAEGRAAPIAHLRFKIGGEEWSQEAKDRKIWRLEAELTAIPRGARVV
jgi:hypothetical protein